MKREKLERAIESYFDSVHSSTWGRQFDLINNRKAAIEFLATVYERIREEAKK